MSRARPTDRAAVPALFATISQAARAARPPAAPAPASPEPRRRRTGLVVLLRGADERPGREPPREAARVLLVRAPARAAVLLGMVASVVPTTPEAPSATRVTPVPWAGVRRSVSRVTAITSLPSQQPQEAPPCPSSSSPP